MTIHDKQLTKNDMQVHKEILINLARNMSGFGFAEKEVFVACGFDIVSVSNEFEMVDSKFGIKLWEIIIEKSSYPLVGLSFGKNITFSALTWISGLTQSAKTLKDAWKSFCDFSLLMGDMFYYELKEEGDFYVIYYYPNEQWLAESAETAAQACDHAMSLTMSLSAFLCGRTVTTELASFKHNIEHKYLSDYEKVFMNVQSNSDSNKLIFSKEVGDSLIIGSNEKVYQHMLEFCEQKLKEIKENEKYSEKVKRILNQKNSFYLPKLEEVSAMLHISTRTLQRKLKEENNIYQSLVEEHQISQAKNLLKQKEIQVKEVAYLLGYSNTESFNRSFKRSTGVSPGAFRKL